MGTKALRKVTLINEASRGVEIAAAKNICQSFPDSSIYLSTKNEEITNSLNATMHKEYGDGSSYRKYIHLDIDDKDSVADAVVVLGAKFGSLDILVKNAGVYA